MPTKRQKIPGVPLFLGVFIICIQFLCKPTGYPRWVCTFLDLLKATGFYTYISPPVMDTKLELERDKLHSCGVA